MANQTSRPTLATGTPLRVFSTPRGRRRYRRATDVFLLVPAAIGLALLVAAYPPSRFERSLIAFLGSFPDWLDPLWGFAYDALALWAIALGVAALVGRRAMIALQVIASLAVAAVLAALAFRSTSATGRTRTTSCGWPWTTGRSPFFVWRSAAPPSSPWPSTSYGRSSARAGGCSPSASSERSCSRRRRRARRSPPSSRPWPRPPRCGSPWARRPVIRRRRTSSPRCDRSACPSSSSSPPTGSRPGRTSRAGSTPKDDGSLSRCSGATPTTRICWRSSGGPSGTRARARACA